MALDYSVLQQIADGVFDGGYADDAASLRENPKSEITTTDEYKRHVRILAFQFWAFECGQSVQHTQRMLWDRAGVKVDMKDIRAWRDADGWGMLAGEIHQSFSASSLAVVRRSMAIGTVNAVRWLVNVFDNPAVADSVKLRAAMTLLDRGGFPVLVRGELYDNLSIANPGEYGDLTDAELEDAIASYSHDGHAVLPPPREEDERFAILTDRERVASVRHINDHAARNR